MITRLRLRSLRARLTLASVALIAAVLCAGGAVLVWRIDAGLHGGLDAALVSRVRDVAAEVRGGQLSALPVTGADSATIVQVVTRSGHVLAGSGNIVGEPALFHAVPHGHRVLLLTAGAPGAPERVAALATRSPSGGAVVYAARSALPVIASVRELVLGLAVGIPALVLVLGLVVWFLVGHALGPVERMRQEVAAVPGDHPGHRLQAAGATRELQRLAETFNELLQRVDLSVDRQRRLVADSAHELRNPVAAILTRLEVRGMDAPLSRTDRVLLRREAARLATLVDSLLGLARLDAGVPIRAVAVDLDDLVFEHARRLRLTGSSVDIRGVAPAQLIGDPRELDRVVANLLDNAARHAAATVTVALSEGADDITLTVQDDGPGIPPADRDRVFDRFTRLDSARDRDHGGFGLGLAITEQVVRRHGGSIHIESACPGARFVVRLPPAGAGRPGTADPPRAP